MPPAADAARSGARDRREQTPADGAGGDKKSDAPGLESLGDRRLAQAPQDEDGEGVSLSPKQVMAAMRTNTDKTDPGFRERVRRKLGRSPVFRD